jgi:hypothetical protein
MLLHNLKDEYLETYDMMFDYYPLTGKEIYVDPLKGCWRLDMIRSYPLDEYVELFCNDVLMGSYTWDDDLEVNVINTEDYKPLPSNGLSPHEMFEDVKLMIEHCERMNIFYVPKTRKCPPRFKN